MGTTGDATKGVSKVTSKFVGKDMSYETKVNLDLTTSDINDTKLSGKIEGSAVVYEDADEQGIAISKGAAVDSGWAFISSLPIYAQADLTDKTSDLNTIGKYIGKMVLVTGATAGYGLYITNGVADVSLWYLPTGVATGAITPS